MEVNKIYQGNNLETLKTFPDNSIDSIVTDPPYGLGKEPDALEVLQSWITTGYHEIKGKGFMGKEWDAFVPQPNFWRECLRVLKPGGHLLSFAGTRTYDWVVMGLRIAGFEIRDQIAWVYGSGFPKSHNIGIAIDKINGVESKVVGSGKSGSAETHTRTMKSISDKGNEVFGGEYEIKEAQNEWQGWGTALKPALEPIVMARKPLDGTVANNVLKHGVGGINIDGCRVATDDFNGKTFTAPNINQKTGEQGIYNGTKIGAERVEYEQNQNGRFPANFIHDGSDEVVELFPSDTEESASRFFYTAKASQTERNWGLHGFDEDVTNDGRVKPIDNAFNRGETKRKNIHPTVKPIDLMRYLVRLVTPKGGLCLDPFMGSGTTAVACKSEKINYIGCELMEEYIKIAEARIKAETVFYDIFDFGA